MIVKTTFAIVPLTIQPETSMPTKMVTTAMLTKAIAPSLHSAPSFLQASGRLLAVFALLSPVAFAQEGTQPDVWATPEIPM